MSFIGTMRGLISDTEAESIRVDASTHSIQTIDYAHHEIHGGSAYFVSYGVADIGAATTPNDSITLTFTTPNTTKWIHMVVEFLGGTGALCGIREGGSTGASPTGALTCVNRNRNSANTSGLLDIASAAGQVSYDAGLDTGGSAWEVYLPGTGGGPGGTPGLSASTRQELILKQNTRYQVYITDTANVAASIVLDWYEHTDKD